MTFRYDEEVVGIGIMTGKVYRGLYRSNGTMLALPERQTKQVKGMCKLTKLEKALK